MEPFVHLKQFQLVICSRCGFACVANEVEAHLRIRHKSILLHERRIIIEAIQRVPNIIRTHAELVKFQFPSPTTGTIPFLAPPLHDGLRCNYCSYIALSVQTIQDHCRNKHDWVNPRKAGRPSNSRQSSEPDNSWTRGVQCQRFFRSRAASAWFEVNRARTSQNEVRCTPTTQSTSIPDVEEPRLPVAAELHFQAVLSREQRHIETTAGLPAIDGDTFVSSSPWMDRTQWLQTYKAVRRDVLRSLIQLPDTSAIADQVVYRGDDSDYDPTVKYFINERKTSYLLGAMDFFLDRCERTVQQTSRHILCWLQSTNQDACTRKTFALVAKNASRQRYRRIWKNFIVFLFRISHLTEEMRKELVGNRLETALRSQVLDLFDHIRLDSINHSAMAKPRQKVPEKSIGYLDTDINVQGISSDESDEADDEENCSSASSDNGESSDNSVFAPHANRSTMLQKQLNGGTYNEELVQLLFGVCLRAVKQQFVDGQPSSTLLVYFSGILGFTRDSTGFLSAKHYTPALSALLYVQRLLFLECALPLREYAQLNIPKRPLYGQHERLKFIRQTYMVTGSQSSFDELHDLRNFGRNIARTDVPSFMLRWSDDGQTVYYDDAFHITMSEFRGLADYFITNAEDLCSRLMLGLSPEVDLEVVKDKLASSEVGYSFVTHPENGLEAAHFDLLRQLCASQEFVRRGIWNWKALSNYRAEVVCLEGMILGGCHTACGQAPRAEELINLCCENGSFTNRAFYIWNGYLLYILRHHKAKRRTNREFVVARFLPARLAHVVYLYLVWIRRLDALLRREENHRPANDDDELHQRLLFRTDGKLWKTNRLTRVIEQATTVLWGRSVNVRLYRQLSIGITERHVREVHRPFNRFDDRTSEADLNVAFAWQSGHRPLERGATYGLDGAFPSALQPSLLRAYQWVSTRWHEFLHVASKLSLSDQSTARPSMSRKRKFQGQPAVDSWRLQKRTGDISPPTFTQSPGSACNDEYANSLAPNPQERSTAIVNPLENDNTRHRDIVCYLANYEVLICLICKSAIIPGKGIEGHFRNNHQVKGRELRGILSQCATLQVRDPRTVELPANGSIAMPQLPVHYGYSCNYCSYLTTSRKIIICHIAKNHNPSAPRERGCGSVYLQTFTRGNCTRYWVVDIGNSLEPFQHN